MTEIENAIRWNAAALGIPAPETELVEELMTPTTLAALSIDGKYIAVKKTASADKRTVWLAISHEMRHAWQIKNTGWINKSYKQSGSADSIDAYNNQLAEIDAHAWSFMVMATLFGIRPMFERQLGADTMRRIEKRITEIQKEMQ